MGLIFSPSRGRSEIDVCSEELTVLSNRDMSPSERIHIQTATFFADINVCFPDSFNQFSHGYTGITGLEFLKDMELKDQFQFFLYGYSENHSIIFFENRQEAHTAKNGGRIQSRLRLTLSIHLRIYNPLPGWLPYFYPCGVSGRCWSRSGGCTVPDNASPS